MKNNFLPKFRIYQDGKIFNTDQCVLKISSDEWYMINDNEIVASSFKGGILMQYTGKKDINGKEIYEGDIVKEVRRYFDWDKPDGEEEYFKENYSYIHYLGHSFWVKDESFGWEGEALWDWDKIEVVGNIYENKEEFKIQL